MPNETAANGLVLAATEGGVMSIYKNSSDTISISLPNGTTVNLAPDAIRLIHRFIKSWLEETTP